MGTLIQQRMAFERDRILGWTAVGGGAFFVIMSIPAGWMAGNATSALLGTIAGLTALATGLVRVRRANLTRRAFEREHGPAAGLRP